MLLERSAPVTSPESGPSKQELALGDPQIRELLRAYVISAHPQAPECTIIEELGLCRRQVRVDLAVVNGFSLHGYEIKSDRDSLDRLARQVAVYSDVLDRATLVVGPRHIDGAIAMLPPWWEVIRIDGTLGSGRLTSFRQGTANPGRSPRSLVELLWLDQALQLLADRDRARGVRGKPRRMVWDRLCEVLDVEEIAQEVRRCLMARPTRGSVQPCS